VTARASVVIPGHDERDSVGAAVESVLARVLPAYEIIVVDGSPDGTPPVVSALAARARRDGPNRRARAGSWSSMARNVSGRPAVSWLARLVRRIRAAAARCSALPPSSSRRGRVETCYDE
jgi:glycosyltransferase involved in cell wall biosynthesis